MIMHPHFYHPPTYLYHHTPNPHVSYYMMSKITTFYWIIISKYV